MMGISATASNITTNVTLPQVNPMDAVNGRSKYAALRVKDLAAYPGIPNHHEEGFLIVSLFSLVNPVFFQSVHRINVVPRCAESLLESLLSRWGIHSRPPGSKSTFVWARAAGEVIRSTLAGEVVVSDTFKVGTRSGTRVKVDFVPVTDDHGLIKEPVR